MSDSLHRIPAAKLREICERMSQELEDQGAIWLAIRELLGEEYDDAGLLISEYGKQGMRTSPPPQEKQNRQTT